MGPWLGCRGTYCIPWLQSWQGTCGGVELPLHWGPRCPHWLGLALCLGEALLGPSSAAGWCPRAVRGGRPWPSPAGHGGGSGGPLALLSPAKWRLTVVKGQGFQAHVGSHSWRRAEYGGHCDLSAPPGAGAGGKDVSVWDVAAVVPRGLFFQGTGAVCTPSGWTWALPATRAGGEH